MTSRRQFIGGGLGISGSLALLPGDVARADMADLAAAGSETRGLLERLDRDLRTYASFGSKTSGGEGDLATAAWIRERLETLRFAVRSVRFPVPSFRADRAEVRTSQGAVAVFPQPIVVPTPADGITAKGALVYDRFQASTAAGKIAFVVLPHARHAAIFNPPILPLLQAASAAGARAIVLVTTGPTGEVIALNTKLQPLVPVPLALMAPNDFPAISAAVARDDNLIFTMTGDAKDAQSCNIIATRRAGPKWLAFSTPRTGWFQCVGERGPGTAAFLELVRWAASRFPDLSIFAMNNGGHELDFLGTQTSLHEAPPAETTLVWTHLGAGLATRDLRELGARQFGMMDTADPHRVLMVAPVLMDNSRRAFGHLAGYSDPIEVVSGAGELSSFIQHGYVRAFAGLGVHRWCHVPGDSFERVDARLLLPVVEAHRALIEMTVGQLAGG